MACGEAVRRHLYRAVRIGALVGVVTVAVTRLDGRAVMESLGALQPGPLLAGFAALAAGQAVSALRWRSLTLSYGVRASHGWFLREYFRGCFYNALLPTGIGGDASRVLAVRRLGGTAAAVKGVLVDRLGGLVVVALAAAVLFPVSSYAPRGWVVVAIAVAAGAVAIGTALLLARRNYLTWLAWGLGLVVLWSLGIGLLAHAVGLDLAVADLPVINLVVGVAMALPLSIGATGTREAGFALALAPLGVDGADAVALGVVFGFTLAAVGLLGARR